MQVELNVNDSYKYFVDCVQQGIKVGHEHKDDD